MSDTAVSFARTLWPFLLGALAASAASDGTGAGIFGFLAGAAFYSAGRLLEARGLRSAASALLLVPLAPVYRMDTATVAAALSDGVFDEEG